MSVTEETVSDLLVWFMAQLISMEVTAGRFREAVSPAFLSVKQQGLQMEMAIEEGVSRHQEMRRDSSRGDLRIETLSD